jgi:hypothetical protein
VQGDERRWWRAEILWLAFLVSARRSARRHMVEWYDFQIASRQRRLGIDALDQATLTRALHEAAAEADPWPDGVYHRHRELGIPLWALLAADCRPSPKPPARPTRNLP